MEKTVSEAIKYRRSVRRFNKEIDIDDEILKKFLYLVLINLQLELQSKLSLQL